MIGLPNLVGCLTPGTPVEVSALGRKWRGEIVDATDGYPGVAILGWVAGIDLIDPEGPITLRFRWHEITELACAA